MEISFVHAADLHLGRAFSGLRHLPENIFARLQESAYRSLERIVTTALDHHVDFVLFAGDIFDEKSASLQAQIRFKQQLQRLDECGIPAFICHGNHDPLQTNKVSVSWPESVHVFASETVTSVPFYKAGQLAAMIYGFSYTDSALLTNKTDEYIKSRENCYHIGMLHGSAEGDSNHDPYAPFKISDLVEKDFDYWALGHIHKRSILSEDPPVVYPGNIQGLHPKECGEKGCMLVKLSREKAHISFMSTADIVWAEERVDITGLETLDALLSQVEGVQEALRASGIDMFVRMKFIGHGVLHDVLHSDDVVDDLLEHLQRQEEGKRPFIWIQDLLVNTRGEWGSREALKQQPHFSGELLRTIDRYDGMVEALQPLTRHREAKQHLAPFTDEEKREMMTQVETLLLTEFTKGH